MQVVQLVLLTHTEQFVGQAEQFLVVVFLQYPVLHRLRHVPSAINWNPVAQAVQLRLEQDAQLAGQAEHPMVEFLYVPARQLRMHEPELI